MTRKFKRKKNKMIDIINLLLGFVLIAAGIVIFIKYGEYRRKHNLGGLTFKYITFCFGLVAIGCYLVITEFMKIV